MNFFCLILTISAQTTNDETLKCILESSRQRCKNAYELCFDDLICSNQFEDLFENCIIKPGLEIYDDTCIASQYTLITNQLLSDMMNCFILQCNLMHGKQYKIKKNLDLQTCIQEALTDASQCWILAQKCDINCLKSLDKIQVLISQDRIVKPSQVKTINYPQRNVSIRKLIQTHKLPLLNSAQLISAQFEIICNLIIFMIILSLLIHIISAKQTNDQARSCIMSASQNKCKTKYETCFDDINCSNQFEDLFGNCIIKSGSDIYANDCLANKYNQMSVDQLIEVVDCFIIECNLVEGRIYNQKENQQLNQCLPNALADASNCWLLSQKCGYDCQKSLDLLSNCEIQIEQNNLIEAKSCIYIQRMTNNQATLIRECLINKSKFLGSLNFSPIAKISEQFKILLEKNRFIAKQIHIHKKWRKTEYNIYNNELFTQNIKIKTKIIYANILFNQLESNFLTSTLEIHFSFLRHRGSYLRAVIDQ
ncbi:hypothetical protein pb186bvf_006085 [Paramecium bursaria]